MFKNPYKSLNIKGYLMNLDIPKVMGILNVTDDSFYSESRNDTEERIRSHVRKIISQGVDIIDVGGCSTRPGFTEPSEAEEIKRIALGCQVVRELSGDIVLSIDTFRAEVARFAIDNFDADIINDISGGFDGKMWELVAEKKVTYVLTHNRFRGNHSSYNDITAEVIIDLSKKINELHRIGVNDIIIDPGFGFAKTLEGNFTLLDELGEVTEIGLPVMVGISRKSMIYKTLGVFPEESLSGTVALDAIALEKGADILRVHDVKEAKETIKLFTQLKKRSL